MKKRVFALVAALAIGVFALTACSGQEEDPADTSTTTEAIGYDNLSAPSDDLNAPGGELSAPSDALSVPNEENKAPNNDSAPKDDLPAENKPETPNTPASSLAELVAQQNAAMEAANAAAAGQYKIEVKAEGKKLIYSYTYAMELPAEALQASLDAAGANYGGQVTSYKAAGYDIDAVVIAFLDQNGKEIASKEFK